MPRQSTIAQLAAAAILGSFGSLSAAAADVPGDWIPGPWHEVSGPSRLDRISLDVDPVILARVRTSAEVASRVLLGDVLLPGNVRVDLDLQRIPTEVPGGRLVVVNDRGRTRPVALDSLEPTIALGGTVIGDPDGEAFIAFGPVGLEGWIRHDGVSYSISDGPRNGTPMVTRMDSMPPLDPALLDNFCGTDLLEGPTLPGVRPVMAGEAPPLGGVAGIDQGPCRRIRMAIDTDTEFLGLFDGDIEGATSYISTLCAASSFIYRRDVNAVLAPTWVRLWVGSDPWDAGGTGDQLTQFRNYWQGNQNNVSRDLAHFLSGRGLGGGVAWLPGLCGSYAYGLSANLGGGFPYPIENNSGANWDLMVFSHEVGHNCGAPHTHSIGVDGCADGDCSVVPNGTIMSYCHLCDGGLANMRMEFCPENILNMENTIGGGSCNYEIGEDAIVLADAATTVEGVSVVIDAAANDYGLSCGGSDIVGFDEVTFAGGTVTRLVDWVANGRDALLYVPPAGFIGTDSFTYQVRPEGVVRAGNVTVTILESDFRDPENPNATVPGVAASYYVLPNDTAILPDFNGLESYATSIHERIDFPSTNGEFADTGRNDDFGVVWTGWLDIPTSGNWTLGTESDDGSRLFIGDEVVVDNDGLHGMQSRSGTIGLDAGRHAIRVEFFERGGGAGCIVKTGGPGVTFGVIPDSMWSHGGSLGPNPDINGDGLVDGADLGLLLGGWNLPGITDLNQDDITDGGDLGLLLSAFGTTGG
ncbi:MAG: hypothetical protein CMJ51_02005 [Planctomycetaceae bacterium]|nr:hypothetical protein [Planctomycetaceae bacterium]